jgi:hypothetical protein
MRLPRMTTRRWMIAVAGAALLLGGAVGGNRLKQVHSRLLFHEARYTEWHNREWDDWVLIQHCENLLARRERQNPSGGSIDPFIERTRARLAQLREKAADDARRLAHHETMVRKYLHAARYPWLAVAPDPPEPE